MIEDEIDISEMPEVLLKIPEIKFCCLLAKEWAKIFEDEVMKLFTESFAETATERGIEKKEKMYLIKANASDTLEERRFAVLIKEKLLPIINFDYFKKMLIAITDGHVEVSRNIANKELNVKVGLSSKKNFQLVKSTIKKLAPVDLNIDVALLYNRFGRYSNVTFNSLSDKKFIEIKEMIDDDNG